MYLGKVVETGTRDDVYEQPMHPYTVALLSAAPEADPELERTSGTDHPAPATCRAR